VPYRPPTDEELILLPPIPTLPKTIHYPLVVLLGTGQSAEQFQPAPNPYGVNISVCRDWQFVNGLFVNYEAFTWPSFPTSQYRDLLVYDPNWPWNKLLLTKRIYESAQKQLTAPGVSSESPDRNPIGSFYGKVIAAQLAKMLEKAWWNADGLTWQPGEFVIPLMALQDDIVDTRSDAVKRMQENQMRREETRKWAPGLLPEKNEWPH
jgi:hypothetical protein